MKHTILSFVLILSFLTPQVQAAPTASNAALIEKLLAQIATLQAELNRIIVARGGDTTTSTNTTTETTPTCTFTRLLKQGTQGTDVTCLQTFLKAKGHFSGTATGYFGPQTKESVATWQRSEGIVAEAWEYGNFGEQSRGVYTRTRNSGGNGSAVSNSSVKGGDTTKAPTNTTRRSGGGGGGGSSSRDRKVPTLPRSFDATPNSSSQVVLSWEPATDADSGIRGYNIYRRGESAPINPTPITDTTFIDTGLRGGTSYEYEIEAIDNAGNVGRRTPLESTRTPRPASNPDTVKPTTPGTPTASLVTQNALRLSWTASTDAGGSNLTGYKLYRNGILIATPINASYDDANLAPQTNYSYTVIAYDGAGNVSGTSSPVSVRTLTEVVPVNTDVITTPTTPVTTSAALDSVLGSLTHDGPAVLEQIALYLPVTGSLAQTATAEVRYKVAGASQWTMGHPLHRIQPDFILTHYRIQKPPDAFAWPIIDVKPDTAYDIEVTVKNGTETAVRTLRHTTRSLPPVAGTPNKFIRAGASSATITSTLNGLNPGDVLEIDEGTYTGNFTIARRGTPERPIYIRGKSRSGTILSNTTGNTITLTYASDLVIENLTLRGPGVDGASGTGIMFWNGAPNQDRITVRNVTISGTDLGIKAWQKISGFLAYDNTLVGNNLWTTGFIDTSITWNDDGINVAGSGNAVFNNTLKGFGDSLALDPQQLTTDSINVHFYRNEIISGGDDGFEADGAHRNVTFYDNRLTNTMTMISLDPVVGGPLLAARNISINTGRSPLKMNNTDTGHFIYNNTMIRTNDRTGWALLQPNNGYLRSWGYRNNILIYNHTNTTQRLMAMEPVTQNPIDFTHNSWFPDGSIWWSRSGGSYNNLATTYARLPTTTPVFSGSTKRHEQDQILPNGNPWTTPVTLGTDYKTEVTQKYVPTLAGGSSAKNSGVVIPNVTTGYTGSAPDRGAVIAGRALPVWGDRTGVVVTTPVVVTPPTTPTTPTPTSTTPAPTPSTPTTTPTTPTPTTTVSLDFTPRSVQTSVPTPAVSKTNADSLVSQIAATAPGRWVKLSTDNTAGDIDPGKDPTTNVRFPNGPWYNGTTGYGSIWQAWNSGALAPTFGPCGTMLYYGGGHADYFGNAVIGLDLCGGAKGAPIWRRLTNPYDPKQAMQWPYPTGAFPDGTPSPAHITDGIAVDPKTNKMIITMSQGCIGQNSPLCGAYPNEYVDSLWVLDLSSRTWNGPHKHNGGIYSSSAWDTKRNILWFQAILPSTLTSFNPSTNLFTYYNRNTNSRLSILGHVMGYDPVNDKLVETNFRNAPYAVGEFDPANTSAPWKEVVQINKPTSFGQSNALAWSPKRSAWIVWMDTLKDDKVWELKRTGVNASGIPEYTWTLLTDVANTVVPNTAYTNGSYEKFQVINVGGTEILIGQLRVQDGVFAFKIPSPSTASSPTPAPPISTVNSRSFLAQARDIAPGTWSRVTADNLASDVDPQKDATAAGTTYQGSTGFRSIWEAWNSGALAPSYGKCGGILNFGGGHNDYFGNEVIMLDLCGGLSEGPIWRRLTNPYKGPITWPYNDGAFPNGTPSPPHTYDGLTFDESSNSMILLNAQKNNAHAFSTGAWLFSLDSNSWSGPFEHRGSAEGVSAYDTKRQLVWFQPAQGKPGELTSFNTRTKALNYYGWPWLNAFGIVGSLMGYDPENDKLVVGSFSPSTKYIAERDPNNPTVGWKPVIFKDAPTTLPGGHHAFAWSKIRKAWILWDMQQGSSVYAIKRTGVAANGTPEYTWTLLTAGNNTTKPLPSGAFANGSYKKFQIVETAPGVEVLVGQLRLQDGIYAFRIPAPVTASRPTQVHLTSSQSKTTLEALLRQLQSLQEELKKLKH